MPPEQGVPGEPEPVQSILLERLGVVVVHYHQEQTLLRLLENLRSVQGVAPGNVVVVDNGSNPELMRDIRRDRNDVMWVDLPNPGYGAAMNAGVAALPVQLDVVALLTHEVTMQPRCLAILLGTLLGSESTGLVGPLLMDSSRVGIVWSTGGRTSSVRRLPENINRGVVSRPVGRPRVVDWVDGSVCLMRRADLAAIGGLAAHYFLYFEDVDLGWRVRTHLGKQVICDTRASAAQAPGGHMDQFLTTRNFMWMLSDHRMVAARLLFIGETVVRLVLGPVLRPAGGLVRVRRRFAGLAAGLRRPNTSIYQRLM